MQYSGTTFGPRRLGHYKADLVSGLPSGFAAEVEKATPGLRMTFATSGIHRPDRLGSLLRRANAKGR